MKKFTLMFAGIALAGSAFAQTTYNYFDPADCDKDGWLWFDTQEKIDKYVGWGDPTNPSNDPKIILQTATFEPFDEPMTDPDMEGYNAEGVQGGEGAWTGAIILPNGSVTNGSDSPDGGGILLHLPDCAEIDLALSTEDGPICVGLKGGKGWIESIDCGVIQTYMMLGSWIKNQLTDEAQYVWKNVQNVDNKNTGLKLASPEGEKVTMYLINNIKRPLLVQGIKVLTYTDCSDAAVSEIGVDENASEEYFNLQGMKVVEPKNGIFIRRQGSKAEKTIIR